MKKYKKVLKDEMSDLICDICHQSCFSCGEESPWRNVTNAEYATLEANWGYFSNKDGESFSCEMCESCFDKVVKFIDFLKLHSGNKI